MDHLTSLAFSLHSNKGAYALLVGSGISRSAGIPTGWEVTLDMIRKVAVITGEDAGDNPEEWFKTKFKKDPAYSDLLDTLAKAPSERATFLKGYFEPTAEERDEGKKSPTAAHRSIAKLVASGHVKVIVTTNFDRLLERAIEDEGITSSVISTPDMCDGATPLIHTRCTIIKVNGDYLDMRSKNTVNELTSYDHRIESLLDRVFDDFGMIVCGWSGDWDIGLRGAIERTKGRRYTTFWTKKDELTEIANSLVKFRGASIISISDADSFFVDIQSKLSAIEEINAHPMSSKLAVVTLKKYLAEDKYKLRLHELVLAEMKKVMSSLDEKNFPMNGNLSPEIILERLKKYNSTLGTLAPFFMHGSYWGKFELESFWIKNFERIANVTPNGGGLVVLLALRHYPALLLYYSAGIACVLQGNFKLLHKFLHETNIRESNGGSPAVTAINAIHVMDTYNKIAGYDRSPLPMSDFLFDSIKEQFKDLVPDEESFVAAFDYFEYFLGMAYVDATETHPIKEEDGQSHSWAPLGRYAKRSARYGSLVSQTIEKEIDDKKKNWIPLQAGFFGGSYDRVKSVKKSFDKFVSQASWRWT
ncbi:SIR2 family protein [Bdellovibrio bacteriovorus]|uniref:SIR2 family protein n=1 Tax=Bdellovibrio bacteriovorus TaxID=959 RepID=UPI003AA7F8B0